MYKVYSHTHKRQASACNSNSRVQLRLIKNSINTNSGCFRLRTGIYNQLSKSGCTIIFGRQAKKKKPQILCRFAIPDSWTVESFCVEHYIHCTIQRPNIYKLIRLKAIRCGVLNIQLNDTSLSSKQFFAFLKQGSLPCGFYVFKSRDLRNIFLRILRNFQCSQND